MFHRILIALCCVLGVACVAEPDSSSTTTEHLEAKVDNFPALFDQLVAAQKSQPTTDKIAEDPASVIKYSSLEDLAALHEKSCDDGSSKPPAASCAASIAAEQTWLAKENDGCSKRQYCRLGLASGTLTATCRTCMTCCDIRNGQTTCKTSCTGEHTYIVHL